MNRKRICGIVVFICGLALIGGANYIETQVNQGRSQINSAQKSVDRGNSLFSLSPATKGVGQAITGGAQKKIDEGRREVAQYSQLASSLQIGGIILLVVGAGIVLFSWKKKA